MRKIRSSIVSKVKSQVKAVKTTRTAKITFALNASLCQQAENWLNSQWVQHDYTYNSLSELIRKSLVAYQNGEITINPTERDKFAPKREITVRFGLVPDLLNFYYSLPYSQRTAMVEESLSAYLDKINQESKELEKYRKIIEPKSKKVFFHPHQNFTCDKCGASFQNETAYSYATSLGKFTKTYCSNCVKE